MTATLLDFNYIKTCLEKLYGMELEKTVSVIPITKHSFENSQSLFFRNIRKDMQIL